MKEKNGHGKIIVCLIMLFTITGCSVQNKEKVTSSNSSEKAYEESSENYSRNIESVQNANNALESSREQTPDEIASEIDAAKDALLGKTLASYENEGDYYEESLKRATAEQKEKLLSIKKSKNLPGIGVYVKQIKVIMGEMDDSCPSITLEKAKEICEGFDQKQYQSITTAEAMLAEEFNKNAGAPDFDGGSGIKYRAYFVDDDPNTIIVISLGQAVYIDDYNSTKTVLYDFFEGKE